MVRMPIAEPRKGRYAYGISISRRNGFYVTQKLEFRLSFPQQLHPHWEGQQLASRTSTKYLG